MPKKAAGDSLAAELAGTAPAGLDALDDSARSKLAAAIGEARRRQQADIAEALTAALGHVPLLLRGAARKILLPEGGHET
jgi:hypothetical protein